MQTVAQLPAFLRQAKQEGMTDAEITDAVDMIAANPLTGDLIVGTGGMRKVRVAGRGFGKSGGYRVVTFYAGEHVPVFMVAVLSKGSRANFSKAERNAMANVAKTLVASLGPMAIG
jgi:hypothetical protein